MAYQNFYATKLRNAIGAGDTSIDVHTPPTVTSGRLVIEPRNATNREIIRFTGVSGTVLTGVIRGQGGTSPRPHNGGSLVQMNVTAEDLDDALNINGNLVQYTDELLSNHIVPGTGVPAIVSGLTGSLSNIVYYYDGVRLTKNSIPNKVYTASRDTYIFIDTAGTVTYTEVANNAAAPATPANSLPVAKVVTNASTITTITPMSRGAVTSDNIDFTTMPYNKLISTDYSATNNITMTVPEDGLYLVMFSATVLYASGNGAVATIFKNPSTKLAESVYPAGSSGESGYRPVAMFYAGSLTSGDVIRFYIEAGVIQGGTRCQRILIRLA